MKMMMQRTEIVEQRQKFRPRVGVYFLFLGEEIVYIGQSTNVDARLSAHTQDFDSYALHECDQSELASLESRYINAHRPSGNKVVPASHPSRTTKKVRILRAALGVAMERT